MNLVLVGQEDNFPLNTPVDIEVSGSSRHSLLVINTPTGFYAIENRCSHKNVPLSGGEVFDCVIECPHHGSGFELATGEAVAMPARDAIASFSVVIEDGDVFVEVP